MAKSFIGDSGPMGLSNVTCESLDLITECNRSDDNQGCSESSTTPLTEATERPMYVDLNAKPRVWNGGSRETTSETTCPSATDPVIAVMCRSETTGLQPSGDNVGVARGACVPAAEVGEIDVINAFVGASGSETALPPHVEAHRVEVHRRPASRVSNETAVPTTPTNVNMRVGTKTIADVVKASVPSAECKQQLGKSDDGWTTIVRKKSVLRNRFTSETGRASGDLKFKAAPVPKVPLYISNVCKSTTESDIAEYIFKKTSESVVLEKINCKRERDYNSFKLFVSRNKLHIFMDSAVWPEGISFRRFVLFNNYIGRQSSESSNKLSQVK